jgi:hypothetical protein
MQCACVVLPSEACTALLYFPNYLIKVTICERKKKLIEHKFSLQLVSETCIMTKSNEWAMIKNVYWSSVWCTGLSCHILMKLEFSREIFEKYSSTKFDKNPSSWSRVVPRLRADGWTNGRGEANGRFSQFFDIYIYMSKNYIYIYIYILYICRKIIYIHIYIIIYICRKIVKSGH